MKYINVDKVSRLAGEAFINGIRLIDDSVLLFNEGSHASSLQLAILAQEELGKAFLLEETVFRTYSKEWPPSFQHETLEMAFSKHRLKQSWFNKFAEDFISHSINKFQSQFTTDIISGKLDQIKQNATYTGLPRIQKGFDLKGKINIPRKTNPAAAERQITRFVDLVVIYTEGFTRGVYGTDVYDIAVEMNQGLVAHLESIWPKRSRQATTIIDRLRKNPIIDNPLADWEE